MKPILLLLAIASIVTAALNTTQAYHLKTELKLVGYGKSQYNNLWISSYHTGAGLSDVVFSTVEGPSSRIGYLGPTNLTANGQQFYNALFDFGNDFPWGLSMAENTNFYAAWQPVRVNAGVSGTQPSVSGFFINETGLQWTTSLSAPGTFNDEFGGWIVCDWWHGYPQLFFRIKYYTTPAPASCADVYLKPVYL